MNIWQKLKSWVGKDKNLKGVTPPASRPPSGGPSSEMQWVSPTKKYASGKLRAAAALLHASNRRERLKDPVATHRQKLRKLGLS